MKTTFRSACVLLAFSLMAAASPSFTVSVTGSGRPLLLIPGLECSGEVWQSAVVRYRSAYQLHTVSVAGFADQPAVPGLRLSQVKDDLIRYIRDRKLERPVLVGHSLGGFLAFWIAEEAPDLVGGVIAVDGVPFLPALFDTEASAATSQSNAEQIRALYASMLSAQMEAMGKAALSQMITAPDKISLVTQWSAHSDPAFTGQAIYDLMTTDLRPDLGKIRVPVLLIGAGKSASNPEKLASLRKAYEKQLDGVANRRVVVAEKALHFIMYDDPEFLYHAMDEFLNPGGERHAH